MSRKEKAVIKFMAQTQYAIYGLYSIIYLKFIRDCGPDVQEEAENALAGQVTNQTLAFSGTRGLRCNPVNMFRVKKLF